MKQYNPLYDRKFEALSRGNYLKNFCHGPLEYALLGQRKTPLALFNMKKAKTSCFFFFYLFAAFLSWQLYEHRDTRLTIRTPSGRDFSIQMSRKDQRRLTVFFYKMMIQEDGGYTLFACKPMHMGGYIKPFSMAKDGGIFFMSLRPSNIRTYLGWKTWEKYAHLFSHSRFLLWAEENPTWTKPHDAVSILLVHKQKLAETIRTHNDDFKRVLQRDEIDSEMLLNEAKEKPFLKGVLRGHDGLIGTLFGYGRSNAWLFEKRKSGESTILAPLWEQEFYEFMWNNRNSQNLSLALDYPSFYCDQNSYETKRIKNEFLKVRDEILKYYQGKPFLEATIGILLD